MACAHRPSTRCRPGRRLEAVTKAGREASGRPGRTGPFGSGSISARRASASVAREHGDQLTETEAAQALSLYTTQVADDAQAKPAAPARHQHKLTGKKGEFSAGRLPDWPYLDLAVQPDRQSEAGA